MTDPASEEQRQRWKRACLLHLKTYVDHQECDLHLFRNLVDNWYAYERGGVFLHQKSGRPRWFNNPDPAKQGDALRKMLASVEAMKRINGDVPPGRLVKDHVIPLTRLRKIICAIPDATIEAIEETLRRCYRVAIITKEEHDRLTGGGHRTAMPSDWNDGDDPFVRYRTAGIQLSGPT
jgi:hypothetical protein